MAYVDVAPEKEQTVVLLHDIAGDLDDFGDLYEPLSRTHRTIGVDWLGFGKSDKPSAEDQVPFFVELLGGFLKCLDLDRVSLVGHGLGATVAALFAAAHPDAVERLVLSAPFGGHASSPDERETTVKFWSYDAVTALDDAGRRAWYESMVANWNERLEEYLTLHNQLAQSIYHRAWARAGEEAAKSACATTISDQLAGITAPTLVVWGSDDPIVPVADAAAIAASVPGASTTTLDACGHLPMFEMPVEFEDAVVGFVTGEAGDGDAGSADTSDLYSIEPLPGLSPEIGRLARILVDQRRRCNEMTTGLSVNDIDWRPSPSNPSIGAALLHMGAITVWYLHEVLLREPVPIEECTQFHFDPEDLEAPLRAPAKSADRLLADVAWAHDRLTEWLATRKDADLNRSFVHRKGHVSATLRWILWRLIEDAVHHRGQVATIKRLLADRETAAHP